MVRFDLGSCGPKGFKFDADEIIRRYDPGILVDKETDFGEYLNVAATIAATLNERIQLEADSVLGHLKLSFDILDALSSQNNTATNLLVGELALRLLSYNPRAKDVWGDWLQTVLDIAKPPGNKPGSGVDTLM
jgi:hypothetical protein